MTGLPLAGKNSGFTLIELLVAMGVLVLVTGLGISALIAQGDKQTVLQTAKGVQQILKLARSRAQAKFQGDITSNTVLCASSGGVISAIAVTLESGVSQFLQMRALCADPITGTIIDRPEINTTFVIPDSIMISNYPAGDGVAFVTFSGAVGIDHEEITITGPTHVFKFDVGMQGRIEEGYFE